MPLIAFNDYQEVEWKEFEVAIEGADCAKLLGLEWSIESDDEELFAAGDEAISIQSGNIKKSGTLTILKGALDDMTVAAKAAGGRWVTDVKMTVTATFLPAVGRPVMVDTLGGLKIGKMPKGWKQGDKSMSIALPFKFLTLTTVP